MTEHVDVEVNNLKDDALDHAVARAIGWIDYPSDSKEHGTYWHTNPDRAPFDFAMLKSSWHPSTNWNQCGGLIERFGIVFDYGKPVREGEARKWFAQVWNPYGYGEGETPLIAVCRALTASKLGETVSIPSALLGKEGA